MLKCIRVESLRMGMWVEELRGSWQEHPFWRDSFLLNDPKDLERILESSIREVWIDSRKGLDVPVGTEIETEEQVAFEAELELKEATLRPRVTEPVPIKDELSRAAQICQQSRQAVMSMFQQARMGKTVDADLAHQLVEEISDSVARNASALISLARLKTADDYTYMHSVAVCALMIALSRQMGLSEMQTRSAGLAGLLHDLGKATTPPQVLNKPGKLTPAEFVVMKRHTIDGYRMLQSVGNLDPIALDVCLHHHEKVDGSGYPEGLKDQELSLYAKMGAVCDVYDAITSDRPYKAGWDPAHALHKMAEWSRGHFDQRVFQAFVKSLGIYPVGSLLRLSSDRWGAVLAVVVEQSPQALTKPVVRVFYSVDRTAHIAPQTVDLSSSNVIERIVGREDPVEWEFEGLDQFWAVA